MFEKILEESNKCHNFLLFKKGIYCQILWPEVSLPKWGWKIHISATIKNFKKIFFKVFNFCLSKKICFKFISSKVDFVKTFSKSYNRFSSGKFITIYCLDDKHFFEIANLLKKLLAKYKGPFVLTDKPLTKGGCVYYRFGIFKNRLKYIYSDDFKEKFKDNRNNTFRIPKFIKDPFDKKTKSVILNKSENEIKIRGTKFIYTIKKALHFSNFGGIYISLFGKNGNNVCLIKEFRPYMFDIPEMPAIKKGIQEFLILKKMSKYNIVPKIIESFFCEKHFFFSRNFINGDNLKKIKINKTVSFFKNFSKNESNEFNVFFLNLYKKLERILVIFHKKYITINDIKLENFILNKEGEVLLADCDSCTNINKKTMKPKNIENYFVFNPDVQSNILDNSFKSDFIKLNLMVIDLFCQTSNYTNFDKNNSIWRISKKLDLVCKKYNINNFFINSLSKYISVKINNKDEIINFFNNFQTEEIYSNKFLLSTFIEEIQRLFNFLLLNKLNFKEKFFSKKFFNNFLLNKKIYLTNKDLKNIDWALLLIIVIDGIYCSKNKLINFVNNILKKFFKNKINSFVKTEKLFLYASCFLIKLKFGIDEYHSKKNLNIIFDFIINQKLFKNNDIYLLKNIDFLSPHLNNGTVGFIFLLSIYFFITKDSKYEKTLKILFNIFEVSYLSKISFLNGISGYLLIYLFIKKIDKKNSNFHLNFVKEKLVNIFLSIKNNKKEITFIDLYSEINKNQKEYYLILFSLALSKKILKKEFHSEII